MIFLKLVKAGYGTLKEIKEMNAEEVIQALFYETFLMQYQEAYLEKSREK